jgi:uncharacterized membrane protein YjjB (DUF3815 family)
MTLLQVGWLSILLGITLELLLVAARLGGISDIQPIIAEFAQKISWSFVVCMGLAVGMSVSQLRPPVMGLAGLVAAPLAFYIAKGVHAGVSELLGTQAPGWGQFDLFLSPALRGIEYLVLGAVLGWVMRQTWGGLMPHIGAGLAVGALFGGLLLLMTRQSGQPMFSMFSWVVNELLFPTGCALVLFASNTLAQRLPQGATS